MGRLYKRGQRWWGYWRDEDGTPHRETLATTDREVARKRLRRRELGLVGDADPAAHTTLKAAVKHLLDVVYAGRRPATLHCYRQKARHLLRLFEADRPVGTIARDDVQQYRADRIDEGAAPGTVAKELVVLRLALREQGIVNVVPPARADYRPRTQHLTFDQAVSVLAALPEERRLWVMVACYLGCRDSEIDGLRVSDIDLDDGMVLVRGTKTKGSLRPVPIHAALRPWLEDRLEDLERDDHVVEPWSNRRRDITAAWWKVIGYKPPKNWTKGPKRGGGSIAGAPRLSPNDLRRTFTSWLKQSGVDSMVVARLLGSSTRMVELVYAQLTPDTYRAAIMALPGDPECTAGVHETSPSQSREDTPVTSASETAQAETAGLAQESSDFGVPRDRIELPTRGFSDLEALRPKIRKPKPKLRLVR